MSMLEKLNTLANISSRNEKIGLVQQYLADDQLFYRMCRDALDPLYNYGIQKLPVVKTHSGDMDFAAALLAVEGLRSFHHSNQLIEMVTNVLSLCSEQDATVIGRVLLKDLRCGVQIATVNKAIENNNKKSITKLEPIFDYPCMLTSAYSEKLLDKLFANNDHMICQQKCDGMRFNAVIDGSGDVSFFGRSGKEIYINDPRFYELFKQFEPGTVVDGELLIDGKEDGTALDRKIGNGILNKAVKGTITEAESKRITATLWDVIPLQSFRAGFDDEPYEFRLAVLHQYFEHIETDDRLFPVYSLEINTIEQANEMFNQMIAEGKEGVIVKSPNAVWKNVRSTECIKLKGIEDCDLKVVDYQFGTGRFEGMLGALVCESADGKVQVKVGTGFSEQQRKQFTNDYIVGKIITVQYNMRIKDKNRPDVDSLFLPRFVEVREDKDQANTSDQIV